MSICLYSQIKKKMEENPEATVLYRNDAQLTRGKLLEKANQFAGYLQDNGIKKEDVVCIASNSSFELMACILGILQADGAFLLLSPDMPKKRMAYILDEISPRFVFKQRNLSCDFCGVPIEDVYNGQPRLSLACKREPGQLAYVSYTSGSTDVPKGVMVEDSNVLSYCADYARRFNVTNQDIIIQASVVNFDGFIEEMFVPLLYDASIVIPEKHELKHPRLICDVIRRFKATIYATTPLMLNELNKLDSIPPLRILISTGDVLKSNYYTNLLEQTAVYNMYGPTETTVCVTCYSCAKNDGDYPPIGKPLDNCSIDIMGENGAPVQRGMRGEIYIGGGGVARGYWKDEMLTKQCFVSRNGKRVYRSGDYGYADANGNIHFMGRMDKQVKIRGFRVELGEIESTATKYDGVQNAIAFILPGVKGKTLAMAYVAERPCDQDEFLLFMRNTLPEYMIPKHVLSVDAIPVTEFGKTDYSCLEELTLESIRQSVDRQSKEDDLLFDRFLTVINRNDSKLSKQDLITDWDSITFISIIVELENEYDITFDDEDLLKDSYSNLGSLYDYVMKKATSCNMK